MDVKEDIERTHIFRSRFVNKIRAKSVFARYKSRLVARSHDDTEYPTIATNASTIQRFYQRLVRSLAASLDERSVHERNITQTYTQSQTFLKPFAYFRPPAEINLLSNKVPKVVRPLYGIPESGLYRSLTYMDHQSSNLGLSRFRDDSRLLYRRDGDFLTGTVTLQVDESLNVGSNEVLRHKKKQSKSFRSKPGKHMDAMVTSLDGLEIVLKEGGRLSITQEQRTNSMSLATTEKVFKRQRALAQYIVVNWYVCCRSIYGPDKW